MKKIYLLYFLIMSLISCKTDGFVELGDGDSSNIVSNYNFGSTTQKDFQGVVLDINGAPINGATVQIGSSSVTTNYKGYFTFKNASVQENFAHVKVTKSGYVNASRVMVPTTGVNRVNIMMIPITLTSTVSSGATSTVSLADGTKVKFDGSFKDSNGNAYSGNVSVSLYHLAPSNTYLNELMPGSFLATSSNGSARVMETFGMMHVQLTGSAGQNLQIATGHTAEITVPIDAAQSSTSPSTIPLWSYNESTGMWNEEGSATKVGNTYVGTVSHFSWWNYDIQVPQATLKVTVKNTAGLPLVNTKVTLKRNTQTYEVTGFTDSNGVVTGIIPAGESLALKVYDHCNAVIYTTTVAPVTAGTLYVLPDIVATPTGTNYTIQGNLKTCSNTDVTSGFVIIKAANGTSNFQYTAVPISSSGVFSANIYSCTSGQTFILEAFDTVNMRSSGEITVTPTAATTNMGNITICTAVNEFITYQVDSQPSKNLLPPMGGEYSQGATTPGTSNTLIVTCYPANYALGGFQMVAANIPSVGTYNSFVFNTLDVVGSGVQSSIPPLGNNLTLQITNLGAVGQYIDFTINGSYINSTGTHTLSVIGHVIRDN